MHVGRRGLSPKAQQPFPQKLFSLSSRIVTGPSLISDTCISVRKRPVSTAGEQVWDYLNSEHDRWNYELANIIHLGFRHDVCDWFAWSPFVRWDVRAGEIDCVGGWFDYLTDCLGFRLLFEFQNNVTRIDRYEDDEDYRVGFYVYLRAFGADSANVFKY